MKLLRDKIALKTAINQEKTVGGIIIAAGSRTDDKTPFDTGKVVAVGPGTADTPVPESIMPGATVLYNKFCNGFTSATGEELLILGVEDIVAVL